MMELTRATPRTDAHPADTVSGVTATMVLVERV
jgi:hypothetical protein